VLQNFGLQTKQIFIGNLLLVVCCLFYLAWWVLAFNPANPIKGMKTGWLLIPALLAGLGAVAFAVRGLGAQGSAPGLFPPGRVLWGGALAYVVLLVLTWGLLHRPVTTEMFLIVGWAVLALSEASALLAAGALTHGAAVAFAAVIAAGAAVSLVCYVLYYELAETVGFIAGMVPLLMAAAVMASIDLVLLKR